MLVTMADDKKDAAEPAFVSCYNASAQQVTVQPKKSHVTRKYVIVAVTCALIAGLVLTAALAGIHIYTEAQKEIVKYQRTIEVNKKTAQEDVTYRKADNLVQYHTKLPDRETWVINDFSRDIQILKLKMAKYTLCFVTALNASFVNKPVDVGRTQVHDTTNVERITVTFQMTDSPISDTSILGEQGQALCDQIDTYWINPTCLSDIAIPSDDGSAHGGQSAPRHYTYRIAGPPGGHVYQSGGRAKRDAYLVCATVCSNGVCYRECWLVYTS